MVWTDLTIMIYIVPFVLAALVLLFAGAFLNLSSMAELKCPVCKTRFSDVFDRRRHMKNVVHEVEAGKKGPKDTPRMAA